MDALKKIFASAGLSGIETFIASGNVLFDSASQSPKALEKMLEARLRDALGYEVDTFLRSAAEVTRVARLEPFGARPPGASLYVGFLKAPLPPAARAFVMAARTATDDFFVKGREIYWLCKTRSTDSAFAPARLEKAHRLSATFRNSTTVSKIAALCDLTAAPLARSGARPRPAPTRRGSRSAR